MRTQIRRTRCLYGSRWHRLGPVDRRHSSVGNLYMELDKAFQFAVILAWEDLTKVSEPGSVRVEYRCKPGTPLDHVSVWATGAQGHQDLVCDYWTSASSTHPSGVQFENGYCSDRLAETLDMVMKNQGQFRRHADADRDGLTLIYAPAEDERTKAAAWIRGADGAATNFGGAADERMPLSMPWMANRTDTERAKALSPWTDA